MKNNHFPFFMGAAFFILALVLISVWNQEKQRQFELAKLNISKPTFENIPPKPETKTETEERRKVGFVQGEEKEA